MFGLFNFNEDKFKKGICSLRPFDAYGAGDFEKNFVSAAPNFPSTPGAITSTGGIQGIQPILGIPVVNMITGFSYVAILDFTNLNCEEPSSYSYRIEDIVEGQKPTIRKVRIRYRDLGVCKVTFTLIGLSGTVTQTITLGTVQAPRTLKIAYADFVLTDESMQLSFTRVANSGPLDIISVTLLGVQGDSEEL